MKRAISYFLAGALALACSDEAGTPAGNDAATDAAAQALATAQGDVVTACRLLAEKGAWTHALDLCKRAHEALPDDLSLEHAYQQARAVSEN